MADEKQLDKIDIQSELKTLSPIEAKSIELQKKADAIEITDKITYGDAKKLKRELVSHRNVTKDLRLTFTRKLDNLKDQFIKKQDEVLQPSLAGEAVVKDKIVEWEQLEAERKAAEEKRIQTIIDKIRNIQPIDFKTGTIEDVQRARASIKMELSLLDAKDKNKVAVKNIVEDLRRELDDIEDHINTRIEQERIAEEQRIERQRLDEERKKLEDEKAAAQTRVDEKTKEVESKIIDEAPIKVGVDMGTPEGDKSVDTPLFNKETIDKAVSNTAETLAFEIDIRVTEFLEKNGIEVNTKDIASTEKYLREKGYELQKTEQAVEPAEDEYLRKKHTYTLVKIIDSFYFETAMKMEKKED